MFRFTYNLKIWDWFSRLNWNISLNIIFFLWVSHELHGVICIFIWYIYCNIKFTRFLGSKNLSKLKNIGFGYLVTTTTGGYFAIRISSQTTKKEVFESPLLRTIIPRKLLSFCDTITFAPVQSQVLRKAKTWYNRKKFPIVTASIHCLRLTLHQKLFTTHPSPQQFSESTQKSIGFQYKI